MRANSTYFAILLLCCIAIVFVTNAWIIRTDSSQKVKNLQTKWSPKILGVSLAFLLQQDMQVLAKDIPLDSPTSFVVASSSSVTGQIKASAFLGKELYISGSDNKDGSNPWKLVAVETEPGKILVDFRPKGGPSNLLGLYSAEAGGIKWPDGNVWTKK